METLLTCYRGQDWIEFAIPELKNVNMVGQSKKI